MKKLLVRIGLMGVAGLMLACFGLAYKSQTDYAAAGCASVKVIWARGSNQGMGALEYRTLQEQVARRLADARTTASVEFHELSYPAIKTGVSLTSVGAYVSAGMAYSYGESVNTGIGGLIQYISEQSEQCPDMKYVLAGYSQGGQVALDTLRHIDRNRVVYVAVMGEPKLFLPEGFGINPSACRGEGLSSYNIWAPNCYTFAGSLGERTPYHPSEMIGRVGLWCNKNDFVCGSTMNAFNNSGHEKYVENGRVGQMAEKIVAQIEKDFPKYSAPGADLKAQAMMDVAILIDSTGSMSDEIKYARDQALNLAQKVLGRGGRVALVEYRDFEDVGYPKMLCDFSCTAESFEKGLSGMQTDGGSGDTPEGLLDAMMFTYEGLDWEQGASKSLIVLTDAGFHSPDKSGVTFSQVVKTSLAIDPVNTYILTDSRDYTEQLENLAHSTGGKLFSYRNNTSKIFPDGFWEEVTGYISDRPVALLKREEYSALIGQTVTFDASDSYGVESEIARYEWDFDGDSSYDLVSTEAVAMHTYTGEFSGFAVVKVVDERGQESTMSAKVEISSSLPEQIMVGSVGAAWIEKVGDDKLLLTWEGAEEEFLMISVNGVMIGYTESNLDWVEISDVDFRGLESVTVRAMTPEWNLGEVTIATMISEGEINEELEKESEEDGDERIVGGKGGGNTLKNSSILAPKSGILDSSPFAYGVEVRRRY